MNLLASVVKAAGVTAPPPQPFQPLPPAVPMSQIAATAPVRANAVQQAGALTDAALLAARRASAAPGPAVWPPAASSSASELAPFEETKTARTAWTEGRPRNAPGVWPMFPEPERPSPVEQTAASGSVTAPTPWGMGGIMRAYSSGSGVGGGGGAALMEAVMVVRGDTSDSRSVPLGVI